MGDRISIQFKNEAFASPYLFSHWDGTSLLDVVQEFLNELKEYCQKTDPEGSYPLCRYEPETIMVAFIKYLHENNNREKRQYFLGNYYLTKNENEGDNSDNGHYIVDLTTCKIKKVEA